MSWWFVCSFEPHQTGGWGLESLLRFAGCSLGLFFYLFSSWGSQTSFFCSLALSLLFFLRLQVQVMNL
jgi:hypothetical protein